MSEVKLETAEPWAPHPAAAPRTRKTEGGAFEIAANSTRTCLGGWQFNYSGASPGQAYLVEVEVEYEDIADVRDTLKCMAYFARLDPGSVRIAPDMGVLKWGYLLPRKRGDNSLVFRRRFVAPEGADDLQFRATFRWATRGRSLWKAPVIRPVSYTPRKPVRVCVVTGAHGRRDEPTRSVANNTNWFGRLCEKACDEVNPDLIVLPEIALHVGVKGNCIDIAVPAPGPETEPFQDIARSHNCRIMLGLYERDGDAVHNTAALISPQGVIDGKYRKVHLAVGEEMNSGILPGDSFPVFDTEVGRIGMNICMDSSCAESSRMVGLNGADFLLLPIMGDHRAWEYKVQGRPFCPERWKGIMQTRAMDNQLCVVVARNSGIGSCIIDRLGEVLAWQTGYEDYVHAIVPIGREYLASINDCFIGVNWVQRRPHVYGPHVDPENYGSMTDGEISPAPPR